ncbi:hypothetical protein [Streptomonospora wellingtoniae]|uniref:DNA-binding protein n=1 Tax=Streptomonospora wellingtoniae TaxID=3075544 RepID=A0ABU2KVA0_9ACTN|nr:hypothetical protein [Streptomonospora sp. DSM 45055]MDT0303058.1 hypothetical protein [Streptomonospora sp. DSM 45055]
MADDSGRTARRASEGGRSPRDLDRHVDGIGHMREAVDRLVAHDSRHGGDAIAPAAVRVWRDAQRRLASGAVPGPYRRDYLASVAEVAELAGWLLFDADRQQAARAATLEARVLARHAGDRSMERFALTNLALQTVEAGLPGDSLCIADELLTQPRIPPRVALLARIRRGRALARMGDGGRAANELGRARAALSDSLTSRDPTWTWWVDDGELSGHEGEALLALDDAGAALPKLEHAAAAAAAFHPDGRAALHHQVSLLRAYTAARAWPECESILAALPPKVESVGSGRNRRRLRRALRAVLSEPGAPGWLAELARDAAEVPAPSGALVAGWCDGE